MIPKKIHFCWLSDNPYPKKIQRCIDSWKEKLPDYEIVKWDLKRFPLEKNIWVKEAFEAKKYAFAADYIRLYALYTEGGIYLDSDVEVLKPFNDLLELPYFLGRENGSCPQFVEAAVMGCSPKTNWVKDCLAYYDGQHFIGSIEHQKGKPLPQVISKILSEKYGIIDIDSPLNFNQQNTQIQIFPTCYFSPKNYISLKMQVTSNTYSIHHFAGSWAPLKDHFLNRIEGLFGKKIQTIFWLVLRNPLLNIKGLLRLFKERRIWW